MKRVEPIKGGVLSSSEVRDRIGSYFSKPKSNIEFIGSGSKLLDLALGGGWAKQRISNVIGDRSSGKTLIAIEACANFIAKSPKGKIRYRETESAFDVPYAESLGMPVDRVDFGTPLETVEDLFEDLQRIVQGAKSEEFVVVDSLDALSDRAEMARDMDAGSYGAQKAKNMSQLFRRLVRKFEASKVTLMIISQIRDNIGVVYGRKTTRSGGHALDFYASQVLYLSNLGKKTKTRSGITRPYAIQVKGNVDKNKIAMPFREAEFRIVFGYGIDDVESCLNWLKESKNLKDLKIGEIKEHLHKMNDMSDSEYREEVKRIHKYVEEKWYLVETEFLPTRTKYKD